MLHFSKVLSQVSGGGQSIGCDQLCAEDLQYAERSWVRHLQTESFTIELDYLRNQGRQSIPIYVKQFGLF